MAERLGVLGGLKKKPKKKASAKAKPKKKPAPKKKAGPETRFEREDVI